MEDVEMMDAPPAEGEEDHQQNVMDDDDDDLMNVVTQEDAWAVIRCVYIRYNVFSSRKGE